LFSVRHFYTSVFYLFLQALLKKILDSRFVAPHAINGMGTIYFFNRIAYPYFFKYHYNTSFTFGQGFGIKILNFFLIFLTFFRNLPFFNADTVCPFHFLGGTYKKNAFPFLDEKVFFL